MYGYMIERRDFYDVAEEIEEFKSHDPSEHAANNMKAFIHDLENGAVKDRLYACTSHREIGEAPNNDRYRFILSGEKIKPGQSYSEKRHFAAEVWMPGFPLDQVRYMDVEHQSGWNFTKLRVWALGEGEHFLLWLDALQWVDRL